MAPSVADIVSDVGTGAVGLMLASQLPAVYDAVFRKRSVEHISILPTLGQWANFVTWIGYGLRAGNTAVLQVNLVGVAFSCIYFAAFFSRKRGAALAAFVKLLAGAVLAIGAVEAVLWLAIPSESASVTALGGVAVACNVAMFGAPIKQVRAALAAMDPGMLPVLLTIANTAVSCCWLTFGLLTDNWFVAGPNCAGVALSTVQLGVVAYIYARVRADPGLTARLAEDAAQAAEADGAAGLLEAGDVESVDAAVLKAA